MSDVAEQPRDDAGQFTASSDDKFGRAAELAENGWLEPKKPDPDEDLDVKQAAVELTERRGQENSEPLPILLTSSGETVKELEVDGGPKLALTPEQAADALKVWRTDQSAIDGAVSDAELLESFGIDPLPPAEAEQPNKAEPAEVPTERPAEQGADDEISKALSNPTVVEALKGEFAKIEQARSAYAQQLNAAVQVAELSFLNQFPEFRGVTDAGHVQSIASSIQAQNPQRWAAIQQTAAQAGQLIQAQSQAQAAARQAAAEQEAASFRSYKAEQDSAFDRVNGKLSTSDLDAVRNYATNVLKLSDGDLQALTTDRTARDHRFQRALLDAAKYNALMSSPPKAIPKAVPPVQRPGVAQPRGAAAARDIGALTSKLSQSGSLNDAVALLRAHRESRR